MLSRIALRSELAGRAQLDRSLQVSVFENIIIDNAAQNSIEWVIHLGPALIAQLVERVTSIISHDEVAGSTPS